MLIGYARVSTDDQNLALQNDARPSPDARKCFVTAAAAPKPNGRDFGAALEMLPEGDTLVVWRLDELDAR